jgi:hypothetical protein
MTDASKIGFTPQYAWEKFVLDVGFPTSFAADGTATAAMTAGISVPEAQVWMEPAKDFRLSLMASDFALKLITNPLGVTPTVPGLQLGASWKIYQARIGLDNTGNFTVGGGLNKFWPQNKDLTLGADLALGNVTNPEWTGPTGLTLKSDIKQDFKVPGLEGKHGVKLEASYAMSGWGSPEPTVIPHYNSLEMITDDPMLNVFILGGEFSLEISKGIFLKPSGSYEVAWGGSYSDLATPITNADGLVVVQQSAEQNQKAKIGIGLSGANNALATLPVSSGQAADAVTEVPVTMSKWDVNVTWRPGFANTTARDSVVNINGNFGDSQYWDWYQTNVATHGFDVSTRIQLPLSPQGWQEGTFPVSVYAKFSHDEVTTHSYWLDVDQAEQAYDGHMTADGKTALPNGMAPTNKVVIGLTYQNASETVVKTKVQEQGAEDTRNFYTANQVLNSLTQKPVNDRTDRVIVGIYPHEALGLVDQDGKRIEFIDGSVPVGERTNPPKTIPCKTVEEFLEYLGKWSAIYRMANQVLNALTQKPLNMKTTQMIMGVYPHKSLGLVDQIGKEIELVDESVLVEQRTNPPKTIPCKTAEEFLVYLQNRMANQVLNSLTQKPLNTKTGQVITRVYPHKSLGLVDQIGKEIELVDESVPVENRTNPPKIIPYKTAEKFLVYLQKWSTTHE